MWQLIAGIVLGIIFSIWIGGMLFFYRNATGEWPWDIGKESESV